MISSRIEKDIAIAKITDNRKLNVLNADEIKNALTLILRDYDKLIFNLEGIVFIDSTGFGALITIFKRARENDKLFKMCNISPEAMELLKITKLDKVFEIYGTLEECIESYK
jgi:anti-sigma B factor antagonist